MAPVITHSPARAWSIQEPRGGQGRPGSSGCGEGRDVNSPGLGDCPGGRKQDGRGTGWEGWRERDPTACELVTGEGWMGEFQSSEVQLFLGVTIPGLRGSVLAGRRFPCSGSSNGILLLIPSSLKRFYFLEERAVEIVSGADQSSSFALPISLLGLLLSFLQAVI